MFFQFYFLASALPSSAILSNSLQSPQQKTSKITKSDFLKIPTICNSYGTNFTAKSNKTTQFFFQSTNGSDIDTSSTFDGRFWRNFCCFYIVRCLKWFVLKLLGSMNDREAEQAAISACTDLSPTSVVSARCKHHDLLVAFSFCLVRSNWCVE